MTADCIRICALNSEICYLMHNVSVTWSAVSSWQGPHGHRLGQLTLTNAGVYYLCGDGAVTPITVTFFFFFLFPELLLHTKYI